MRAKTCIAFDSRMCYRFRPVGGAIWQISVQITVGKWIDSLASKFKCQKQQTTWILWGSNGPVLETATTSLNRPAPAFSHKPEGSNHATAYIVSVFVLLGLLRH
jgi:hypothetical protein